MTQPSTDDDNYDDNSGYFDDNDDKYDQKHTNIVTFEYKFTSIRDYYLVKKGQTIRVTPPPAFRAMPKSKRLFSIDVFPNYNTWYLANNTK